MIFAVVVFRCVVGPFSSCSVPSVCLCRFCRISEAECVRPFTVLPAVIYSERYLAV